MGWRRRWGQFTTVLCVLIASSVIAAPSAHAGTCTGSYMSRFDGYLSTAPDPSYGTFEGASSILTNNPAVPCTGSLTTPAPDNFAYEFVMVHQSNSAPGGTGKGYAQIGFFQYWGSCEYYTTEYNRDNSDSVFHRHIHTEYGCLSDNAQHQYWVQYRSGQLYMNVDVTVMDITPFNPYTYWKWGTYGPFQTQFTTETKYITTDIAASIFQQMQVQRYNDTWTWALPIMYSACPWPTRYIKWSTITNNSFALQTSGSSLGSNC